jgi:acyl-CoA thioesterase
VNAQGFLGLTRSGDDEWRFDVTQRLATPGRFLFGGCGLAAALVALEEASERPTIWATAQYLSYAMIDTTMTVTTDLAVVGGHVTQGRAVVRSEGREILTVNAALGYGDLSSPTPWVTMPDVASPEDCPARVIPSRFDTSIFNYVDTRVAIGRPLQELDGTAGEPVSALWARVPGHLEPSAATLAIFGDFVSGGASQPMGRYVRGRSLDNTIRVASLVPSEWVLCEIHMHALANGFGQGTAFMWSRSGTLLATASQSIAAKLWEPSNSNGPSSLV